jgi:hypothetical protein
MENLRDYDDSDQEVEDNEETETSCAEENALASSASAPPTKPVYNVFDSLTLELLSNKTQYKKYILSKENPEKYEEYLDYLKKCKKHQMAIVNMVSKLLVQPEDDMYDKEIKHKFEVFAKNCIQYFDDLEEKKKYSFYEKDEDVLFADMDNDNPIISTVPTSSLWGKSIHKIGRNESERSSL